ncbi:hypothetical protein CVT26_013389 [Gymnopilus dilepis]|uniref:Uncharacterized protein n=1 Tax=Gymnopilus dilepis TaxID=231916 RepID=A0A409WDF1_9AGAR|nr:hypothetical protein CVT26_013389 [Gymnopilus dilepis]
MEIHEKRCEAGTILPKLLHLSAPKDLRARVLGIYESRRKADVCAYRKERTIGSALAQPLVSKAYDHIIDNLKQCPTTPPELLLTEFTEALAIATVMIVSNEEED